MQASHLRFMERRTFDNISCFVFPGCTDACYRRCLRVFSPTISFAARRNNPDRKGLAIGEINALDLSTANPSFTTYCIQVIPNRNTEMCGGSILLEPHGSTSRSGNVCSVQ
ncbi:hypothetical protein TNCV_2487281 [Trichonephila clavipes]|uniref:Uncharacterized protein n=1 Tax=Trichonephila clavipes TaxID=2585209 RepID=A0A8X7BBE2_TRICX|nr:hypothetical protein TNCV_2487281 [Trichonephila clavipes]